jgi:hypothetical protein
VARSADTQFEQLVVGTVARSADTIGALVWLYNHRFGAQAAVLVPSPRRP